ncbi:MAG TPA: hypothetical protein VF800_15170 [Telluria sp.]|jgi:hypothetical protein
MSGDVLKLAKPSGKDPWGNSALPEDVIAKTRSKDDLNRRVKELEKNIEDIKKVNEAQDKERQKAAAKNSPAKKTPASKAEQTSHIGHIGNHRAVAIESDICRVGKCIVAFNSYSLLPDETAGSHNVKAIGTRVLREGDLIKGVEADAGKNIASGTSLCDGYLAILEGHPNVKSNGARVALHNSLCRINTDKSGAVGPLARMMTVVKPVGVPSAAADTRPPPGERTSERLEALKKLQEKNKDKLLDFDASDDTFRFKELSQSTHDVIGLIKGEPGTLVDHGAQAVRGGLGFAADIGIGIGELVYEGVKLVPKTLQSNLTPSGITEKLLDNAILLENLRLGNITPGTIGQDALAIGAAIVKPVTEPWKKGQTTEAVVRGGAELGTILLGWTKASKAKKALDAKKAAEAVDEAAKVSALSRVDDIELASKAENSVTALPDSGVYVESQPVKMESVEASGAIGAERATGGLRRPTNLIIDDANSQRLSDEFAEVGGDPSMLRFNRGAQTSYVDELDIINVRGDVLPIEGATHPRSSMSSRAVLAHERGHSIYRGTNVNPGAWNDEFRASYWAAKNAPGLNSMERVDLLSDAIMRAREAGVPVKMNKFMRELLYGY